MNNLDKYIKLVSEKAGSVLTDLEYDEAVTDYTVGVPSSVCEKLIVAKREAGRLDTSKRKQKRGRLFSKCKDNSCSLVRQPLILSMVAAILTIISLSLLNVQVYAKN